MLVNPLDQLGLIKHHLDWYPLMELRDVYKLLYQGVMGAEHLVSTPKRFVQSLITEYDHLQPDPTGRLFEPVRPDQTLLRLNLRVYKSQQEHVDLLVSSFLKAARFASGNRDSLQSAWREFNQYCEQGLITNFDPPAIDYFDAWLVRAAYPPLHHSDTFRQHYQPAYRLIASSSIQQLGLVDAG